MSNIVGIEQITIYDLLDRLDLQMLGLEHKIIANVRSAFADLYLLASPDFQVFAMDIFRLREMEVSFRYELVLLTREYNRLTGEPRTQAELERCVTRKDERVEFLENAAEEEPTMPLVNIYLGLENRLDWTAPELRVLQIWKRGEVQAAKDRVSGMKAAIVRLKAQARERIEANRTVRSHPMRTRSMARTGN